MMDSSFRDWAGLPVHLLDLIVAKLGPLTDYLRYCAVCSQWHDAAFETDVKRKQSLNILKESRKKLPMLVLTTEENNDEKRGLYSIFDRITYNIELPFCYRNKFIGSSHGWLICVEKNFVITLMNPFTKSCISLPTLKDQVRGHEWFEDNFEYFVQKAILTADPLVCTNNYAVLIIYGDMHKLAVCKSGNLSWDFINILSYDSVLRDIVTYKDYLYGVTNCNRLVRVDIDSGNYKTIVTSSCYDADGSYLVESLEGDLLFVKRIWDPILVDDEEDEDEFWNSLDFKVFKLSHPTEEELGKWVQIHDLGEQALFVGDNRSIAISTIDFPKCKPNSIYYTHEEHTKYPRYKCLGVDEDLGFYTLADRSFHLLGEAFEFTQPSIWFVPNPE